MPGPDEARATRRGRKTTTRGRSAAARSGWSARRIPISASCTSARATACRSTRRRPRRRQPLSLLGRRARHQDRQAEVVLPDDPPRHLGSRHRAVARALRRAGRRTHAQSSSPRCEPTASCSCSIARPASRSCRSKNARWCRTRARTPWPTQPYPAGADRMLAGLRRMEKADHSVGLQARMLLRAGVARRAEPADAGLGHARDADGLQPADRLLLRARQRVAAVVPPRRRSVRLHPRRRAACRACRRATA